MRDRSDVYASHLDGLASALERAGAPADAAARLLELSSLATMTAVALEHARCPGHGTVRSERPAEQQLRRAAA